MGGIGLHGLQNSVGALSRADTGTNRIGGIDRHRKVGLVLRSIISNHEWDAELARPLRSDWHTDQTAGFTGEEIDDFRRDFLGGDDQITLVLAVLVVHQDDHLAITDVVKDVGY